MKFYGRGLFLFLLSIFLLSLSFSAGGNSRAAFSVNQHAPWRYSDATAPPLSLGLTIDVDDPQKTVIAGFDFANLDRSVSACQDFNRFANGGWMAKIPIPGAFSVWGRFTQLDEQNILVLNQILADLLKKKNLTGNEQKIADYYGSCMDEQKIEAEGAKPLDPE